MKSTVAAAILTLLIVFPNTVTAGDEDLKEQFAKEFNEQLPPDDPRKEEISKALLHHARCKDWKWPCVKACRAQIPFYGNETEAYCSTPVPGETCFGQPIDYNYVSGRQSLPAEYEVLRRLPKCWSYLAPLLCGMIYRPCGVYDSVGRVESKRNMKMEVWQRFNVGMCMRVREYCEDAIKEGFFPSELIDCDRTSENGTWIKDIENGKGSIARYVPSGNVEELKTEWERQTIFTDEQCNLPYAENASRHSTMQCIFPLVYTMHEKIRPVIDKCFLPCRNPLISSPDTFLSFRVIRAVLCFFFAALFLSIFVFLASRSKIYADYDCIFSIACCFLCCAIYLAFFGLGSITYTSEASECTRTAHGVAIRNTPIEVYNSMWCTISSMVLHVSLLACMGFLAAAYPLSAVARNSLHEEEQRQDKMSGRSGAFRAKLGFGVVVASLCCAFVAFFLKMVSTDGIAGVCIVGLHSFFDHLMVVALPGVAFCLIGLGVGMRDTWREKKQRESEVEHAVSEKIREAIDHEKAKKKVEFWTDRGPNQKEDIQQQMRQAGGPLQPVEERGESTAGDEAIVAVKEEEALILQGDDDEEKEWLTEGQKADISAAVRMERRDEWRAREKMVWHQAISSRFTLVALCVCIGSLLLGLGVHFATLANNGSDEYDAVKAYVTCVMSKSLVRKDTHWLSEGVHAAERWTEGEGEADPLERRHNLASEITIHSCVFPSTGDGRIVGLILVFVLLPVLPVCVHLAAFAMGIAGMGGMAMVMARRPKKVRKDEDADVEMTQLTREHDEESQMMSSVASSRLNLFHPQGPSSSISTAVSFISAASEDSALSSVSVRGELARFPSAERLRTVRATSPVPSRARSEVVAAPERRAPTVGHHRVLDVMGRTRERRERSRKKKKNRASSAEMEARREGVAESGQLAAPRNPHHTNHNADDAHSVSSHSTVDQSAVSSNMAPPSAAGMAIRRNADALMNRVAARQVDPAMGMQQQLQIVQEELLQRVQPGAPVNANVDDPQDLGDWMTQLQQIRTRIQAYTVHVEDAQYGMTVAGNANALGRVMRQVGTDNHRCNYLIILFGLERLHLFIHHLEHNLVINQQLRDEMQAAEGALSRQRDLNTVPNAHEVLTGLDNMSIELELVCPEVATLRAQLNNARLSEVERNDILREMRDTQTRRLVLRMVERSHLALIHPVVQPGDWQQRQHQQGGGRPPVYAPMHLVDLTQPPPGDEGGGAASEASFSVTNSTVPSSTLSTIADEDHRIRIYHDAYRRPPVYESPSTASLTPTPSDPNSNNNNNNNNANDGVADFLNGVARANRYGQQAAYASSTGGAARFHRVPTASENGVAASNGETGDEDVMSSETSLDTIERRAVAPHSSQFGGGSFAVPVHSSRAAMAAAAASVRPPVGLANLFPSTLRDGQSGSGIPPVGTFPGARPMMARQVELQAREQLERLQLIDPPSDEPRRQRRRMEEHAPEESQPLGRAASERSDDNAPPARIRRVCVADADRVAAAASEMQQRRNGTMAEENSEDSGVESLDNLKRGLGTVFLAIRDENGENRESTSEEAQAWARTVQRQIEERIRQQEMADDAAGPSKEEEQQRKRRRMLLRHRYQNHSDPDIAMAEEERLQREADEEREREERRRVIAARVNRGEGGGGRGRAGPRVEMDADDDSISSQLTAEEQAELVQALRHALERRSTEGLPDKIKRLIEHLILALDTQGGISREEIMRFRVNETNRENRDRQQPERNSPYSVSSVVVSRMSLAEIGARVDAIRRFSTGVLYPLEIYYQLHLADVLWPLAGRDVVLGDNVYTHDEINRVLGTDSPLVPADADSEDFHHLMRKRAITSASLAGRAYGRQRGDAEGTFTYEPPRLPDMGVYRTFGDPAVVLAAIDGDMQPILDAINRIPLTMPDVMRLDNHSERTLGTHLRHFRDYLDEQAGSAGYPLRPDTYNQEDAVPPEPTGSRNPPGYENGEEGEGAEAEDDDPDAEPPF